MNIIKTEALTQSSSVTMTSLELVDYINEQDPLQNLAHNNFMAKVPKVLGSNAADSFEAVGYFVNGTGAKIPRKIYRFPKREACLMAMSYSYDLQAKVFDRMTALESKPMDAMQVLSDPVAMRSLLLTYTEQVIEQRKQLEVQAPKVAAFDLIATHADGSMCITNAAKSLQTQPKRLFAWMQEHDWIYRRAGGNGYVAYQARIKTGYLDHKITTVERSDGTAKMVEQVLVTAKGLARLAGEFGFVDLELM